MPFKTAINIIYNRGASIDNVKGKEFILQLILASADVTKAVQLDKYMHIIDSNLFDAALFLNLNSLDKMCGWGWAKKEKIDKSKLTPYIQEFINICAPMVNATPEQFYKEYFKILLYMSENDKNIFFRNILIEINADDKIFKKFKLDPPKKKIKQQTFM